MHATPHITNLIRNGPGELNKQQLLKLQSLGMHEEKGEFFITRPQSLDETYITENFKLHFTRNNSPDAVQNINYVIRMGTIFEDVWDFFSDSLIKDLTSLNSSSKLEIIFFFKIFYG